MTVRISMLDFESASLALLLVSETRIVSLMHCFNRSSASISLEPFVDQHKQLDTILFVSCLLLDFMIQDFTTELQISFRKKFALYVGLSAGMWQNVVLNVVEAAGGGISVTLSISMPELSSAVRAVLSITEASMNSIVETLGLPYGSVIFTSEPGLKQSQPPDIYVLFTMEIVSLTNDEFTHELQVALSKKLALAAGISQYMWQSVRFLLNRADKGVMITVTISMPDLISAERVVVSLTETRVIDVIESVLSQSASLTLMPGVDQSLPPEYSIVFDIELFQSKSTVQDFTFTANLQSLLRQRLSFAAGLQSGMWKSVTLRVIHTFAGIFVTVTIKMPNLATAERALLLMTDIIMKKACLAVLPTSMNIIASEPFLEQSQPLNIYVYFDLEIPVLGSENFTSEMEGVLKRKLAVAAGLRASMWQRVTLNISAPTGGRITLTVNIKVQNELSAKQALVAVTEIGVSHQLDSVELPSVVIISEPGIEKHTVKQHFVVLSIELLQIPLVELTRDLKIALRQKLAVAASLDFSRWFFIRLDQMKSMNLKENGFLVNISLPCISTSEAILALSRLRMSDLESLLYPVSYRLISNPFLVTSDPEPGLSNDPPRIMNYYPSKAYTRQEVMMKVELSNIDTDLIEKMQTEAQISDLYLNISIDSYDIFDEHSVLLNLKVGLTMLVGKARITMWTTDGKISPIYLYFEYLPVATAIGNFEPKSDLIFGGSILTLQVYNLPQNFSCSNVLFYFPSPSKAECLSFEFFLSSQTAKISLRLPPATEPGSVSPTMILIHPEKLERIDFPQNFAYLDPPKMLVDIVHPSVTSISKPTKIWIQIKNFPPFNSSSDLFLVLKTQDGDPMQLILQGEVIPNPSSKSAYLRDVQFTVLTPTLTRPGLADLEIYHRSFSRLKVLAQIIFFDQLLPQVKRLTLLETGTFSLDGLPLQVGSSSEKHIAISLTNIPNSIIGKPWSVQGQFVRGLQYSFLSESPNSANAVLKINNMGGSNTLQYGLLIFSQILVASCNSSCCADFTCGQETNCGNEALFVCFTLAFFDDRAVEVISVDSTTG